MDETTNMRPQALDVHALYRADSECGHSLSTWRIARRLRAIQSVANVLSAEREETLSFGPYLRSGLIEAIAELAFDASCDLEGLSDNIKAGNYLPK